jgi:DNA-binding response OmpR family regulator
MPIAHKILVVDDDELIHGLIASALRPWPFRVLHAYDGEDGVLSYLRYGPSLMLLDIDMPVMNGLQVLRQLAVKANSLCPVIVMSGLASNADQARCLELGAHLFMAKPFRIKGLIESIHALVAGRGQGGRCACSGDQRGKQLLHA